MFSHTFDVEVDMLRGLATLQLTSAIENDLDRYQIVDTDKLDLM